MNKKILIGSILAVAIILLSSFSSTVAKTSVETDMVEFDIEFCGLGKRHTVHLTQQQAKESYVIFDDIKRGLSGVETREETEDIFTEAITKLDTLGLLGEVSISEALDVVLQPKYDSHLTSMVKTVSTNYHNLSDQGNYLCYVAGNTSNTKFSHTLFRILNVVITLPVFIFGKIIHFFRSIIDKIIELSPFNLVELMTDVLIKIISKFFTDPVYFFWGFLFTVLLPIEIFLFILSFWVAIPYVLLDLYERKDSIMSAIMIGNDRWGPATGWVETIGENGNIYWNGTLWGQLPLLPHVVSIYKDFYFFSGFDIYYFYTGIMGFRGIKMWCEDRQDWSYIGNAIWVNLGSERPDNPWIP